ncbi:hypothetical protein M407DRAFT_245565 [Tulasnella calospora MUT 4182]|uniref:Mitochondrial import inner membrane translocase subunit n=1 Tax=Tulasnella calospora MUT 4182 TaxID=1051891 RepID=A0A0C3PZW4_9AGAM|nr:hypothetical protein M407DRAFT_245565 [Tulasnella calospora MUT 4182]
MDFLKSGSSTSPSPSDMAAQKELIKEQVRNEIAMANAQALVNKMTETCYAKCITKPSTSLGSSDETCLGRCMERYMEAFNVVSKTYVDRMARERESARASSS